MEKEWSWIPSTLQYEWNFFNGIGAQIANHKLLKLSEHYFFFILLNDWLYFLLFTFTQ